MSQAAAAASKAHRVLGCTPMEVSRARALRVLGTTEGELLGVALAQCADGLPAPATCAAVAGRAAAAASCGASASCPGGGLSGRIVGTGAGPGPAPMAPEEQQQWRRWRRWRQQQQQQQHGSPLMRSPPHAPPPPQPRFSFIVPSGLRHLRRGRRNLRRTAPCPDGAAGGGTTAAADYFFGFSGDEGGEYEYASDAAAAAATAAAAAAAAGTAGTAAAAAAAALPVNRAWQRERVRRRVPKPMRVLGVTELEVRRTVLGLSAADRADATMLEHLALPDRVFGGGAFGGGGGGMRQAMGGAGGGAAKADSEVRAGSPAGVKTPPRPPQMAVSPPLAPASASSVNAKASRLLGATAEQITDAQARKKALSVLGLEEEDLGEWEGVYDANWAALVAEPRVLGAVGGGGAGGGGGRRRMMGGGGGGGQVAALQKQERLQRQLLRRAQKARGSRRRRRQSEDLARRWAATGGGGDQEEMLRWISCWQRLLQRRTT